MKRFLKWCLHLVAALAILLVLFHVVENWRGKHAWEVYQREREAKGDSFEWKSVTPPPVPNAENFAMTPLFAELFPKPPERPKLEAFRLPYATGAAGNWQACRVENLEAWKRCFTNDDLLAALKVYEPMMREISVALQQRPKCRFPIRYEDGVKMLLPHLAWLRNATRVSQLRALEELSAGQTDAAFEDARVCSRLADTIKDEPTLLSFLVRVTMLNAAAQVVWEGLAAHRWNEWQLAAFQAEFSNADQLAMYALTMRGERLFGYSGARWLIENPKERMEILQAGNLYFDGNSVRHGEETLWSKFIAFMCFRVTIPTGWWYQNLLSFDRMHTETIWLLINLEHRRLDPAMWRSTAKNFREMPFTPFNFTSRAMFPIFAHGAEVAAVSQTTVDEVVVACALERYRLAKGALPEKLDALVPKFLAKVPTDVIDGKPLRYQRDGEHFKVWSVGWNTTDDNGVIATIRGKPWRWHEDEGDWVWQYPAENSQLGN